MVFKAPFLRLPGNTGSYRLLHSFFVYGIIPLPSSSATFCV